MHVVVLGAGISGLTTALALARQGESVTVVAADASRTTSHLAAAVWFPTAVGPAGRVAGWGAETFAVLAAEAAAGAPGVVMRESMSLYRSAPARDPWTEAVADLREARPDELPPGYSHGLRYVVPLVEMPVYLPHLLLRLREAGVRTLSRRVGDLTELRDLAPDVLVNAAGLAAGPLAGDPTTYPVRGQVVRVRNPGLRLSVRDELHPGGRAYVHPRSTDCILGGTLEKDVWDTRPDEAETAAILDRCADIVPEVAGAEVLETVVGLRPGRAEVRLELDDGTPAGVPVVHNYGHGGSGVTLGWGCAAEVARLVAGLGSPGRAAR